MNAHWHYNDHGRDDDGGGRLDGRDDGAWTTNEESSVRKRRPRVRRMQSSGVFSRKNCVRFCFQWV